MPPATPPNIKRSLAIALVFAALSALLGYQLAPRTEQPLTPPLTFSNATTTIEATGSWNIPGSNIPNATRIFCWFPSNSCQLAVAELVPEGNRARFQLVEKVLDIVQLSDATLTATASTTDACQRETLHIDRTAQTATLSVGGGALQDGVCVGNEVLTATLGN